MLSTLTLQEKHANDIDLGNTSDIGIKNAKNIIEILHKDINIEVLEDGCKITCITCRRYIEDEQVESSAFSSSFDVVTLLAFLLHTVLQHPLNYAK